MDLLPLPRRSMSSSASLAIPRPHRLPAINVDPQDKALLLAKYGDLTRGAHVSAEITQQARLMQAGVAASMRRPAELEVYVTRRELEERLAQMEHRLQLLTNGARQQDSAMRRMEAALRDLETRAAEWAQVGAAGGGRGNHGARGDS